MATKKETVTELFTEQPTTDSLKTLIILEQDNKVLKEQVLSLQQEIVDLNKTVKDTIKSKEEIIANEHHMRQQYDEKKNEVVSIQKLVNVKEQEISQLKNDLTKLANLFDEYITAYQDQVKMLGVFVKNTQTVEKYLEYKIEEYNGGSKK
jgi:chromosome segregation ATPase